MKRIWTETATMADFRDIEIGDWIEGVGTILTHFEKSFVRRYGHRHLTPAALDKPSKQKPIQETVVEIDTRELNLQP